MSKRKNFSTRMKELSLTGKYAELMDYLRGKKAVVTSSTGGHNYGCIGTEFIIKDSAYLSGSATASGSINAGIPGGNNIKFTQFSIIEEPLTKEELEKEIESLRKKKKDIDGDIQEIKDKINYLKETGNTEYDENEFKAYHTLELLEDPNMTRLEKSKLIARLVNK